MADVFHNLVEHGNNVSTFLCQKQFVFTPVVFCDVFSQPTVGHKVIDVFGNDALLALDRLNQVILADARVFVDNDQVKKFASCKPYLLQRRLISVLILRLKTEHHFSMLDLIFCSF